MKKPTNYESTVVRGEFEPIELGGHKMTIKQVKETKSKNGLDMLIVLFDFAADDKQPEYFMTMFKNDIRPEKKYPRGGTDYMVVDDGTEYGVANLKRFITSIERSNVGFSVNWEAPDFGSQFVGKKVGGVFGVEKDIYNNKEVTKHVFKWYRSIDGIEDAKIPKESTTKDYDNFMKEKNIADNGTDFLNVDPGSVGELPFN